MKSNQKILEFKKVQIATLEFASITGGNNSGRKNCFETLQCSQSIGTGETTSTITIDCNVDF